MKGKVAGSDDVTRGRRHVDPHGQLKGEWVNQWKNAITYLPVVGNWHAWRVQIMVCTFFCWTWVVCWFSVDCKTFLLYKNLNDFCQKSYGQGKNLNKLGCSRMLKSWQQLTSTTLSALYKVWGTFALNFVGARTEKLASFAAILRPSSRILSTQKNLCLVIVGEECFNNCRSFQSS